ncbi:MULTISPECIES: ABC transporter ATP-binding protein [Bacillota]|uniref:ABC transporter ATP-binding protein n=2 Tax=Amedibacillus TaxID=2749846 RepID=A0A7G9GJX8_9FIRM|nr:MULTISPECIES: ABC transporter ATP-binding protein [Bacillota]QNM11110.1 ABC transporter ATP-binding protein [[Eubacterium] hominis]MCH4287459.1 ABC transporter ATP-binding protein/permease [Amedibacillus hominis]RGB58656.1 ABC transporter ATP-binding protein [Absiella sp. AM22-9]RGB63486.1 ABC transporter ATP-binding protein [Absiella sp. AM10-20]RGB66166.1 ABC transporter ATP-binding protein [Absiella sp. AM09-45]
MNKHKLSKAKRDIKGLMPFIAPYKWQLFGVVLMIIVTTVSLGLAPGYEGKITTRLMQDVTTSLENKTSIQVHFDQVLRYMTILFGFYLAKTFSQAFGTIWLTNAIQHSMRDLRSAMMNKIRKLPVRYFDSHHYGDVLSRITNDIDAISNALQQSVLQVLSGILTILMALFMMFSTNVTMACIAFMIIPLTLLITQFVVRKSQKLFQAQQNALGDLNGAITEMYTGYNEILLYNKQEESIHKFKTINENLRKNASRAQFVSSAIGPLNSFVTYCTIGVVAVVGTIDIIHGRLQVGNLQAFVRYIWQVNDPLSQVSNLSSQIQSAFAALGRVMDVLNEPEEVAEKQPAETLENVKGNVSFSHVKFGYNDEILMKDLNLEVKSGQMVAIVGPTGAGKTTLINLLLRFYDVKGGSIKIDGVDIRDMKRGELRSMFGMVLQDTWLFNGSVYDNIRYGRLDARNDEIVEAAKMANVDHFIRTLPEGYHSFINEEANNISQGEKQLLTIARAILKNPSILILDEATSSVDTRLEKMLQDAMQKVMKGRTSFVIAHRLSTIRNADLILVIQNGDIVEQGTHESLMEQKGFYEKLYNSQFQEEEE